MKRFNITPDKCRFVINKEKKTVVCILNHTKFFFLDFAYGNFMIVPEDFSINNKRATLYRTALMPDRFYGIARCSEDDEWNEEVGKSIAFSRMKDKLNHSFFKRCSTYIKLIDEYVDEMVYTINEVGDKLSINTEKRHAYINSLIGEEPNADEDN